LSQRFYFIFFARHHGLTSTMFCGLLGQSRKADHIQIWAACIVFSLTVAHFQMASSLMAACFLLVLCHLIPFSLVYLVKAMLIRHVVTVLSGYLLYTRRLASLRGVCFVSRIKSLSATRNNLFFLLTPAIAMVSHVISFQNVF
jgi:hypothetical protein